MEWETMLLWGVVWLLVLGGLVGTVLPLLPGIGLVYGGILLHAFAFGTEQIGMPTLVVFGLVTLLSMVIDYLASAYGASRFGATRFGVAGSAIGGLAGLILFSLPGLVLGVFAGAALGELLLAKKDTASSVRAGYGSVIGFLGGTVIKLIIALIMAGVFAFKVLV